MDRVDRKWIKVIVALIMVIGFNGVLAQDSQWRGADRDGKYLDTGLLKSWPDDGPGLVLKKEGLGNGFSTPIVYDGAIFLSGRRDSVDVVTKLDFEGNIHWETVCGMAWDKSFPETRSTPTIENDRLYIMGGLGTVVCINTVSGEQIWSNNTHEEFKGEFHRWGMAESLLLTDNAVISSPVGDQTAVVALDKSDGSILWKTESIGGQRSYVSPMLINHNGIPMILVTTSKDFFGVDPSNGTILWKYDIVSEFSGEGRRNNTNTPLYHDGDVFTTSGYDVQAVLFTIAADGRSVTPKWSDGTLDTHHGGIVLVDGYLYGSNWVNNGNGNWVCQKWETGEVMYEEKWYNKGSVIYADGLLYLFEEKQGHVGLVEPTPEGFRLISSFETDGGSGPYWAHMSIYNKMLLIRHGKVLFVYDIARKN